MTTEWEPELLDAKPEEFTPLPNGNYIQRRDIRYVEYHSLDGSDGFKGYECLSREISTTEYNLLVRGDDPNGLQLLQPQSCRKVC